MIRELTADWVDVSAAEGGQTYPALARRVSGADGRVTLCGPGHTAYGYCAGPAKLHVGTRTYELDGGQYFCAPGYADLRASAAVVMVRRLWVGVFQIGGPLEKVGRLRYIDGCTDSLLVHPPRKGDPCLNHLHFPAGIRQTMHTHPTARVGMVARGGGECVQPAGTVPFRAGLAWYLPAGAEHCFNTDREGMDVVAWHPDSTTGPSDEDHPMLNRTLVNGESAATLDAIRTRDIAAE